MIRYERHQLGPRVHVLGRRVHEWELGLMLLALAGLGWGLGIMPGPAWGALLALGSWCVIKDWHDLIPSRRDTRAWRLGVHRTLDELRAAPRGAWLPPLAAAVTAVVALVNLASALTPGVSWRGHLLLQFEPVDVIPLFHALAVPASFGLLVVAGYLGKRRRRAWQLALVIVAALAVGDMLKGLDIEEAVLTAGLGGLLWWGREAFCVEHEPLARRTGAWAAPVLALVAALYAFMTALSAAPANASVGLVAREAGDLLLWSDGPVHFHGELLFLPISIGALSAAAVLLATYTVFRPLAAPRTLPSTAERRAASELVHAHGRDTLAYFKLRRDKQYLFSADGGAFLGYRVESGVLLVSGDPVGREESLGELIDASRRYADARGLRLAALGASARTLPLWRAAGLHSIYVGDEAVIDTDAFSLDGRPIRKVRQSVSRLEAAGYSAEIATPCEVTRRGVDLVSEQWRRGAPERGFSMAHDSLDCGTVIVARDGDGDVRGYLHFVPTFGGRPAASLSAMRRDPATPNGLTEFLVVRAIELMRGEGVAELSLNFAAFGRLLHSPRGKRERALGRTITLLDRFFQVESLYRFNAKFFPRWEPRYLVYDRALSLPRVALSALWAEGQLKKPGRRAA